ncbi:MAG: glycosyltransferase family 9 protein [Nocardioidaceae bacterium]
MAVRVREPGDSPSARTLSASPPTPARRPVALVLRALGLGDLLTTVPALRGVRAALPEHRLVLATSDWLRPLVPLVGGIDDLLETDSLEPLDWHGASPDVAVNLHGRGPQSHLVLMATRPVRLVAFGRPELGIGGPTWEADAHEVERWAGLVRSQFGQVVRTDDLRLDTPPSKPVVAGAIIIHPGAASSARQWPPARFAAVAKALSRLGAPVVVTGSAAERELVNRVVGEAGLPARAALFGRSLTELVALVAAARLVVSGDTGVAHLATAFATPSVVLFGPVDPALWGPTGGGPHVTLWRGETGDPHADRLDPGLETIQADEVTACAESVLSASVATAAANHSTVR